MKRDLRSRDAIFVLLVLWLSLFLTIPTAVALDQAKLKIGVVYGFTGAAEIWSEYGRMGLELARDEINQAGGVNGQQIELIFEDSRTIPAQSVTAYRKLIAVDHVPVVIGNVWAFITNPLIPLAKADHVLLLSPTAMPESLEKINENFFTMGQAIESSRAAVDLYFRRNQDVKKIGIFCWDDTWGQAYLKVWREVAANNNVEVAATICNNDFNVDFRTDVTKIAAKKVDAVIIANFIEVILKRMAEQRFSAKVLTTSGLVEELYKHNSDKELFEGAYFTDWQPSADFSRKFQAKFGKQAVIEAHNSYESLRSVAKAIAANPNDPIAGLKTVTYQGVAGEIDFSRSQFANKSVAKLYQVRDGKIILVE